MGVQPDALAILIQSAHHLQSLGRSIEAHQAMVQAYQRVYQASRQSPHDIVLQDQAARLFSHQLLLQWSFADLSTLQAQLETYYQRHVAPLPRYFQEQSLSQRPHRQPGPLRVGFLSPDLRQCSAARLIADVFAYAPRNLDYRIYATYPYDLSQDEAFAALFTYMTHERGAPWHDVSSYNSKALAQHIYNHQIDILIDLAGHTSLSNLQVMARQPAPIQVSGLTFNGGLGLGERCLRITDAVCTPLTPETSPPQALYPHDLPLHIASWISHAEAQAYPLPPHNPTVTPSAVAPHATPGYILGCAHHPGRLSKACLTTWATLLSTLPASTQLHLKHPCYQAKAARERILDIMAKAPTSWPFNAQQIVFFEGSDYPEYLHFLDTLDLALDPFPYHGGLVSCDLLWRGIPFVTLNDWMGGGASLLKQLDAPAQNIPLTQGIAQTPEAYIERARQWLQQSTVRARLRQTLPAHCATQRPGQPHRWVQDLFTALEPYIRL